MPPVYSGSLPPKKKAELQEIALALRINNQGTKDELVLRITKYLDSNQDSLEDNPTFAGLFGRRKRSVQPQPIPSSRLAPFSSGDKSHSSGRRSIAVLDSINESTTPTKDLRNVSTFLKHPISPTESSPNQSHGPITPSSLPPLPQSAKSLIERLPRAPVQAVVRQFRQQEFLESGNELLISLRLFLSNSRNIWSVTAVVELFYILSSIIPWKDFHIPLPKGQEGITIHYPPLVVFQTTAFWVVLLHWALPTLIVPALFGCMITFNPALAPKTWTSRKTPVVPLDPLTASIIRLAAQMIYPYSSLANKFGIVGLDVLGHNWRILSASVGLAFSFAEAIAIAPKALTETKEVLRPLRRTQLIASPSRRAITATGEEDVSDEVD